jgi:hypothetical protein
MKKQYSVEFNLIDESNNVYATLKNGTQILNYENLDTKSVIIRQPLATKDELEEAIKFHMENNKFTTKEECIKFLLGQMDKNITNHIQKIRSSVKKLNVSLQSAKILEKYLNDIKGQ